LDGHRRTGQLVEKHLDVAIVNAAVIIEIGQRLGFTRRKSGCRDVAAKVTHRVHHRLDIGDIDAEVTIEITNSTANAINATRYSNDPAWYPRQLLTCKTLRYWRRSLTK
jgi:hypothetical protein